MEDIISVLRPIADFFSLIIDLLEEDEATNIPPRIYNRKVENIGRPDLKCQTASKFVSFKNVALNTIDDVEAVLSIFEESRVAPLKQRIALVTRHKRGSSGEQMITGN